MAESTKGFRAVKSSGRASSTPRVRSLGVAMTVRTRIAPSPTGDPHVGTAYVALQLRLRPQARRAVHPAHRGHRPERARRASRRRRSSRPALARPRVGRGPRRRRPARPLPPERAHGDLPRARRGAPRGAATPTAASAPRERLDALRAEQQAKKLDSATTATAGRSPPGASPNGAPRPASRTSSGSRCRRRARPSSRDLLRGEVALRQRPGRRPGPAQDRRLPDLPPGQRGRRPPDGDHPRHPRRGVDHLDAQARPALPRASAGRRPVFCHLPLLRNADKSKISKRKNPVEPQLLPARGLPPGGAAQLPRPHGLVHARRREKFTLDEMVETLHPRAHLAWAGRSSTSRS